MDANRLRRLAAEVDHEHRAVMEEAGHRLDRRALVRGLGGFAVTVAGAAVAIPALAGSAGAQQSSTTVAGQGGSSGTTAAGVPTTGSPTSAPAATTTTTSPPSQPQPTDLVLLAFAQSVELAVVQLYGTALESSLLSEPVVPVMTAFRSHHRDYAQAYAGMAGKAATGIANQTLLAEYGPRMDRASSERDLVQGAYALESAAAAGYTAALAVAIGTDPAGLIGSIQPIICRHALVLGTALNVPVDQYSPVFEPITGALTPTDYPILVR